MHIRHASKEIRVEWILLAFGRHRALADVSFADKLLGLGAAKPPSPHGEARSNSNGKLGGHPMRREEKLAERRMLREDLKVSMHGDHIKGDLPRYM